MLTPNLPFSRRTLDYLLLEPGSLKLRQVLFVCLFLLCLFRKKQPNQSALSVCIVLKFLFLIVCLCVGKYT